MDNPLSPACPFKPCDITWSYMTHQTLVLLIPSKLETTPRTNTLLGRMDIPYSLQALGTAGHHVGTLAMKRWRHRV